MITGFGYRIHLRLQVQNPANIVLTTADYESLIEITSDIILKGNFEELLSLFSGEV